MKMRTIEETIALFPHKVITNKPIKISNGAREELRSWFIKNGIRPFNTYGDAAGVFWDKQWKTFYFKSSDTANLFRMKYIFVDEPSAKVLN